MADSKQALRSAGKSVEESQLEEARQMLAFLDAVRTAVMPRARCYARCWTQHCGSNRSTARVSQKVVAKLQKELAALSEKCELVARPGGGH